MVAALKACTREEQRAVIRFLDSEGEKAANIHLRHASKIGGLKISVLQTCAKLFRSF